MKRIFLLLIVLIAGHANAKSSFGNSLKSLQLSPYIGVEYMYQHISGNDDWRFILPANLNNIAFFAGTKFKRHFALELGYFYFLKTAQNNATLADFNGQPASGPTTVRGRLRTKGYTGDVSAHCFLDPKFNVFALIGLVNVNPHVEFVTTQTTDLARGLQAVKARKRTFLRIGAGAEYLERHWGARAKLMMDDTQHMKLDTGEAQTIFSAMRPQAFQQSFVITAGVFYRF